MSGFTSMGVRSMSKLLPSSPSSVKVAACMFGTIPSVWRISGGR
jgi:hypothetical protein